MSGSAALSKRIPDCWIDPACLMVVEGRSGGAAADAGFDAVIRAPATSHRAAIGREARARDFVMGKDADPSPGALPPGRDR